MHHGDETEHETEESPKAADEVRTDREDGGPTEGESDGEAASGSGTGTRPSQFEPHE